jgi:hypothetical protein
MTYNNNDYSIYKKHEEDAFDILFLGEPYKKWSVKSLRIAAKQVVQSPNNRKLNTVVEHLKQSLKLRKNFSLGYSYAPLRQRIGHAAWSKRVLQYIIDLINSESTRQKQTVGLGNNCTLANKVTVPEPTEQEQTAEQGNDNSSVDEANFLCFLEDIELCVAQAYALWQRVAAGEVHLSTASLRVYLLKRAKDCSR